MSRFRRTFAWFGLALLAVATAVSAPTLPAPGAGATSTTQPATASLLRADPPDRRQGLVEVARLVYGSSSEEVCFSEKFLADVDRQTRIHVRRQLTLVALSSDDVFNHPFAILTGEKAFTLTDAEKQHLRAYLDRGGCLLASASCSGDGWTQSFRQLMIELYPHHPLTVLPPQHPLFHRLYDIDQIITRQATGTQPAIFGLEWGGRMRVIFSPFGLNDTANAGGGCCCCGGNEVRNAAYLCANALVYALTP